MLMIKPMGIAFGDIKHIIIDILFFEDYCVLFYIWVSKCPKYRQAFLITPLHGARYKTGKNAYQQQVVLC